MSIRLALTIGAVAAAFFGAALLLAPSQMLAGFGLGTPAEAEVLSRDLGVTLIGLGIANWLARNATGPAVRGLLIANLVVQVGETLVNGWEVAAAVLPAQAAAGLLIHIVLGAIFLLALRRA